MKSVDIFKNGFRDLGTLRRGAFKSAFAKKSQFQKEIFKILAYSIEAACPDTALKQHLLFENNQIIAGGKSYVAGQFNKIYLAGAGKAAFPMAMAAYNILGSKIQNGIIVVKYGHLKKTNIPDNLRIIQASHPLPDESGYEAAKKIVCTAKKCGSDDLFLWLASGGSSALMTYPANGISIQDIIKTNDLLLKSGASIGEINTVRQNLSCVKGGNLALHAAPAHVLGLLLSDVEGDDTKVIGSGPTVYSDSNNLEAIKILKKFKLLNRVPKKIADHLFFGKPAAKKNDKTSSYFSQKVQNIIIANNYTSLKAAKTSAIKTGFTARIVSKNLRGDVQKAAKSICGEIKRTVLKRKTLRKPALLIWGGETTVKVTGKGKGGRCQELALWAALHLNGIKDVCFLAIGTDGTDGPTDAAGAYTTGNTVKRALNKSLEPQKYLANNDSYNFFKALDDLIITGPTLTNVRDILFGFVF